MWLLGPTSIWQSHREEKRFPQHCQEWGGPLSTSQLLTDYTPSCMIVELSVVITWRMHTKNEISKDFINYNICIYMKIVCIITIYTKFWDQKRFEDLYSGFLLHSWGKSFAQPCPALCVPTMWPARLLCLWNFPAKGTGVGGHPLLQGNLPSPGIEPRSPSSQAYSLPPKPPRKSLWLRNHSYSAKNKKWGILGHCCCSTA